MGIWPSMPISGLGLALRIVVWCYTQPTALYLEDNLEFMA
jgi:hypothetical protein